MIDILNLALPYFGLIFIGFACGRLKQIPEYSACPDELLHCVCDATRVVLSHRGADPARKARSG